MKAAVDQAGTFKGKLSDHSTREQTENEEQEKSHEKDADKKATKVDLIKKPT